MYKFYKLAESENRVHDYMPSQEGISEKMRPILIDWLVQVRYEFVMNPQTIYLTLNIIHRLDVYIYDYLIKRDLKATVQALQAEAKGSSDPLAIDAPGGFLLSLCISVVLLFCYFVIPREIQAFVAFCALTCVKIHCLGL